MSRQYIYACTLSFGGDEPTAELEVQCSFSVAWGQPESGRFGKPEDYDCGAPDMVEDIKILSVDGKPWPVDLSYGFMSDADTHEMLVEALEPHEGEMISEAVEADLGDRDYADERRAEDRVEAF